MKPHPTPRVVVSRCLEFEKVRYNGQMISDPWVSRMKEHVEFIPVCPEVAIGLGVPRDPIRVVEQNGERKLRQPSTQRDLTQAMNSFAQEFLSDLENVDGFILKQRSPSCGIDSAKIFNGLQAETAITRGSGLFAEMVLRQFNGLAIEDEERLKNFRIREHFLTKLYILARLRELKVSPSINALVEFQQHHKYLLMAYSQSGHKRLGRIAANAEKKTLPQTLERYEVELRYQLRHPPKSTSVINALYHIFGGLSERLCKRERTFFDERVSDYRNKKIPLSALSLLLYSWAVRFEDEFLLRQVFFNPFPRELIDITESGQEREG